MSLNPFEYEIRIYKGTAYLGSLTRYLSGQVVHKQNEPSVMSIGLMYDDAESFLEAGLRYVLMRRSEVFDISPYVEFQGHLVDIDPMEDDFVTQRVSLVCYGYRELLNRRYVLYPSDTAFSKKNGPAETVILSFIKENIGSLANNALRKSPGAISNFTVPESEGRGTYVRGEDMSWQKLSDVVNNYCETASLYLDIVWSAGHYLVTIKPDFAGTDRTTKAPNLDVSNIYRNAPHVFSGGNGNLKVVRKRTLNSNIYTSSTALGKGLDSERQVYTFNKQSSDLERREIVVNSINDESGGLPFAATREFGLHQSVEYSFETQQGASSVYGAHYKCGDKTTIQYEGKHDVVINSTTLDFSTPGESVSLELIN